MDGDLDFHGVIIIIQVFRTVPFGTESLIRWRFGKFPLDQLLEITDLPPSKSNDGNSAAGGATVRRSGGGGLSFGSFDWFRCCGDLGRFRLGNFHGGLGAAWVVPAVFL